MDFDLRAGEVHCLCGENGAGKSTMMNMLYGLLEPTEGQISIDGRPVQIGGPRHAIDMGIGMVHQHFMLIPVFTVAENIVLADEPTPGRALERLDIKAAEAQVRELSEQLRPLGRSHRARDGHHGRPAAARGDPQGALPPRARC